MGDPGADDEKERRAVRRVAELVAGLANFHHRAVQAQEVRFGWGSHGGHGRLSLGSLQRRRFFSFRIDNRHFFSFVTDNGLPPGRACFYGSSLMMACLNYYSGNKICQIRLRHLSLGRDLGSSCTG
jgi:hypothetical protein